MSWPTLCHAYKISLMIFGGGAQKPLDFLSPHCPRLIAFLLLLHFQCKACFNDINRCREDAFDDVIPAVFAGLYQIERVHL